MSNRGANTNTNNKKNNPNANPHNTQPNLHPSHYQQFPQIPRVCESCDRDSETLTIRFSKIVNSAGKFREKYDCTHCGATGTITGYESSKYTWSYSGDAIPDSGPTKPGPAPVQP